MKYWRIGRAFLLWSVLSPAFVDGAGAATSEAKPAGQAEWERTVEAAKKEGLVIVAGPPGAYRRAPLVESFEKAFSGIKVEYTPIGGAQFVPRLKLERAAGQYLWDVHVGGTTSAITLMDEGYLAPIAPALILAEVKELKNWWLGKHHFADDAGKYIFAFQGASGSRIVTNANLVDPKEIKSYWDLLQPKWRGKIGMTSPTHAGTGLAGATFFYMQKGLGPEFLKKLLTESKVVLYDDSVRLAEEVARGKIAIGVQVPEADMTRYAKENLPIRGHPRLKEGGYLSPGFGSVPLIERAPHPSAAKVYINWLLSREGQTAYSKGDKTPSFRVDVPRDDIPPDIIPSEGDLPNYKEEYVRKKDEIMGFVRKVIGKD
jgi:iron(III) transport system substrate-binding protein